MRYPKELKAMALQRMMAPGNGTIGVLAKEFNVTEAARGLEGRRSGGRDGCRS